MIDFGSERPRPERRAVLGALSTGALAAVGASNVAAGSVLDGSTEVADWYDLDAVRERPSDDYVLTENLDGTTAGYDDLVAERTDDGATGWRPIGGIESEAFEGSFDGNGHEITGLRIESPDDSSEYAAGLFGHVGHDGIVRDVDVEASIDGHVSPQTYAGALVGRNRGRIVDTSARAAVSGGRLAGGLVGMNDSGLVFGSSATGHISDGLVLGGLAGWNAGEIVASVADCTTGPVGGGEGLPTTAGLVGINRGLTDEDSDQSRATISLSFALGTVRYGLNCGGLVGTNDGGIRTSFSRAPIEAEQAFSARSNVGGIAGRNRGTVERSFAAGRIDADGSERAGALVGSHRSGTIAECYWDRSATTREAGIGHSVMGGEVVGGYETDQLQGASAAETMAAFDFENTWTTVTDPDDYPTLAWTEVENAPDYDAWTDDDALPGFGLLTTAIAIGGVAYVVGRRFGTASTRS